MSLKNAHPLHSQFLEDWTVCRDTYRGERIVKEKGTLYLPPTSGMVADGMTAVGSVGYEAYRAYKTRAVFHEFMADAVETLLGMMWNKPPQIELPKALEGLMENATLQGEGLEQLLRRINEHQLVSGRLGILADLPEKPDPANPLPYIALYPTETILNWDDGRREDGRDSLNLVVLDESEEERTADFTWQRVEKYRVLLLGDITKDPDKAGENEGVYRAGQFRSSAYVDSQMIAPSIRGTTLDHIPFVFVNTKDIVSTPDDPPLLGLARLCLAIYRGEADYRQALFMQGQDTLVVIGGDDDKSYRIGANASIVLKQGGDAKFIGVQATGLTEMRNALENDKTLAQQKAGNLVDTRSKAKESGEAMSTRLGAQTATLNQIALTGAYALESILRSIAVWAGANPDEVIVTPNLEFETLTMTGTELVELMSAKNLGAPISQVTIHRNMQSRGLTEMDLEEELDAIAEEAPLTPGGPGTVTNPDDPNYDPNKDPNYDPEKDPDSSRFKDPDVEHEKQLELKKPKDKKEAP